MPNISKSIGILCMFLNICMAHPCTEDNVRHETKTLRTRREKNPKVACQFTAPNSRAEEHYGMKILTAPAKLDKKVQ